MDTKTLAHVSGELIAFAGLAVYFQRKSSALEERVRKLEADNNEIIDNLEELNKTMETLYNFLGGKTPHHNSHSNNHSQHGHHGSHSSHSNHSQSKAASVITSISTPVENLEKSEEDEEVLKLEMERMKAEREISANVACENGVCSIVN